MYKYTRIKHSNQLYTKYKLENYIMKFWQIHQYTNQNLGASLLAGRPPYEADCWEPGRELTAERGGFEDSGKQTTRKGATEGGYFFCLTKITFFTCIEFTTYHSRICMFKADKKFSKSIQLLSVDLQVKQWLVKYVEVVICLKSKCFLCRRCSCLNIFLVEMFS